MLKETQCRSLYPMKMRICPTCQQSNSAQALICSGCGAVLSKNHTKTNKVPLNPKGVAQPEHLAHLANLYKRSLMLFILDEKEPVIIHNIDKYILLGRPASHAEAAAIVDLTEYGAAQLGVSRQHVKITPAYNGYSIQDLASTNGTWLNSTQLNPHSLYVLRNGDELRLGQMTMNVYFEVTEAFEETIYLIDISKNTQALSRHALTPFDLSTNLTPFLSALGDLQRLVDEIMGRDTFDIGINRINVNKPGNIISVNIDGAREATAILRHHLIPWRHENAGSLNERSGVLLELTKILVLELVKTIDTKYRLDEKQAKEFASLLLPVIQVLLVSSLEMTTELEQA
jgi:hypothetical protein